MNSIKKLFKKNKVQETPFDIWNINSVDLIWVRKDWWIDMTLICVWIFKNKTQHKKRILKKIETYIAYTKSEEFIDRCGKINSNSIKIILRFTSKPEKQTDFYLKEIESFVVSNNLCFQKIIKN